MFGRDPKQGWLCLNNKQYLFGTISFAGKASGERSQHIGNVMGGVNGFADVCWDSDACGGRRTRSSPVVA